MTFLLKSERGVAAFIALMMMAMLTLIGLAAMNSSDDEIAIAGNEMQEMEAFYAAEAGLDKAAASIQNYFDSTGKAPATLPSGSESLNNCTVAFDTKSSGAISQKTLTTGTLSGLNALCRSFTLTSTATSSTDNAVVQLSVDFEAALIPIFQFAVFYENDLEFSPGPKMQINGRVHCNKDMYIEADNQLLIDGYVTSAANILHGRKGPGSPDPGEVMFKNSAGLYVSMKDGSDWLDANDTQWHDSSLARWQGRVQDGSHGQEKLNLPLTSSSGTARSLISPAAGNPDSYENQADIKFVNGVASKRVGGLWVDVTAAMTTAGVIKYNTDKFTDQRENKKVDVMDLDVTKMYDLGYAPANGVIYFSGNVSGSNWPALRVKNGAELDAGLTIASNNPVYTQGDFNSVNKKPASIMADALTVLSKNFDDTKSTLGYTNRKAVETTINAAFITGNVNTTSTNYNGGLENLPRFLEDWGGINYNWKGSMVNLWLSAQATGLWGSGCYSPPGRNWAYDTDFNDPNNLPPSSPNVRVFQRTGWKQHDVSI